MDPEIDYLTEEMINTMDISAVLPDDAMTYLTVLAVKKQEANQQNDLERQNRIKNLIAALNCIAPMITPKKQTKSPKKSPQKTNKNNSTVSTRFSPNSSQGSIVDNPSTSEQSCLLENSNIEQDSKNSSEIQDNDQLDEEIQSIIDGGEIQYISDDHRKKLITRVKELHSESVDVENFERSQQLDNVIDVLNKRPNPSIARLQKRINNLLKKRESVQKASAEEEERLRYEFQALIDQYNEAKEKFLEDSEMQKYIAEEEYIEQKDIKRHTNFADVENLKNEKQKQIKARNYSTVKYLNKKIAMAQERAESRETERIQKVADAKYEKKNAELDNRLNVFNEKWDNKINEFNTRMEVAMSKWVRMIDSLDEQIQFYQQKLHETKE